MVTFPFFCPHCQQQADATADPVDLLFGGGELVVTCTVCETQFRAELATNDQPVQVKEELPNESDSLGDPA